MLSPFEIVKGYTKPLDESARPARRPRDLISAWITPIAKPKFTRILRSDETIDPVVNPGNHVQLYVNDEK